MHIIKIILLFLSAFLFLYTFWIRLKEDYLVDHILSTVLFSIAFGIICYLISLKLFPAFWFWTSLLGVFVGLLPGFYRYKFRFFETYDCFVVGLLPTLGFVFFFNYLGQRSYPLFYLSVFMFGLSLFFIYIDMHYKKFTWYKSGRVGFSGLFISGIFFVCRALLASFYPSMLSLVGSFDIYLSSVLAIACFFGLFKLSRQV